MHVHKPHAGRSFAELTLTLDADVGERVLADIAAYNAQLDLASHAQGAAEAWVARLT